MKSTFLVILVLFFAIQKASGQTAEVVSAVLSGGQIVVVIDNPNSLANVQLMYNYSCAISTIDDCHVLAAGSGTTAGVVPTFNMGNIDLENGGNPLPSNFQVHLDYSLCSHCEAEMEFWIGSQNPREVVHFAKLVNVEQTYGLTDFGVWAGIPSEVAYVFQCIPNIAGASATYDFLISPNITNNNCADWPSFQPNTNSQWYYEIVSFSGTQPPFSPLQGLCGNTNNQIGVDGSSLIPISVPENDFLVIYNCTEGPCGEEQPCSGTPPSCQETLICKSEIDLDYRSGHLQPICTSTDCIEVGSFFIRNHTKREVQIKRILPAVSAPVDEFGCTDPGNSGEIQWQYLIENVNPGSDARDDIIHDVYVVLETKPIYSAARVSDFSFSCSTGSNCTLICPGVVGTDPCNDDNRYIVHIDVLDRTVGGVQIDFNTNRCRVQADADGGGYCDAKLFNQWRLRAYSFCNNSCLMNAGCDASLGFNWPLCNSGQNGSDNLLSVSYSNDIGGTEQDGIGGNASGPAVDFRFDMIPIAYPGSMIGDLCWLGQPAPANFEIQLAGDGHAPSSVNDIDVFGLNDPTAQHLVRARFSLEGGLTLASCPTINSTLNSGLGIDSERIFRRDAPGLNCLVVSPCGIHPDCNTTTHIGNNIEPGCPGLNTCDDGSCPIACDGYGKVWDVYFVVDNQFLNDGDPTTHCGLESLMTGVLDFELLADCDCAYQAAVPDLTLDLQIDLDFTPYSVNGNICGIDVSNTNTTMQDLDALTWFRLSSIGNRPPSPGDETCGSILDIQVQCPGCLAPGAIACNYIMERTTFGEHDINDDGIVDDCAVAGTNPNEQRALNRSMHGDQLQDRVQGFFQDGDGSGTDGYFYSQLPTACSPGNQPFQVMELLRTFNGENNGANIKQEMGLKMTSVHLQVFRGTNATNCATDAGSLQMVIDRNWDNSMGAWSNVVSDGFDSYLLTFEVGLQSAGDEHIGVEIGTTTLFEFMPNDLYIIECEYEVCGNNLTSDPINLPSDISLQQAMERMTVNNMLYFSTAPQAHGAWTVNGDRVGSNPPYTYEDCTLDYDYTQMLPQPIPPCTGPTNSCGDCDGWTNCIFFCETTRGFHYFVAIGTQISFQTEAQSFGQLDCVNDVAQPLACESNNCNRYLNMYAKSFIGNGTSTDFFPYEIRVPPLELKYFSTTHLNAAKWEIVGVMTQTDADGCDEWEYGVGISADCWDVNLDLSFFESPPPPPACDNPHQVEDNYNLTHVRIIYEPDYDASNDEDLCDVLDLDMWPNITLAQSEELMLFDYLDIADKGVPMHSLAECSLLPSISDCSGANDGRMFAGLYVDQSGGNSSNGQLTFEGFNLDSNDPDFEFPLTSNTNYQFQAVCWNFEPVSHAFTFVLPSDDMTCLKDWVISYDGVPITSASISGGNGGTIVVDDDGTRTNLQLYSLCATVNDCSCNGNGLVDVPIEYGTPCGCGSVAETCTKQLILRYQLDQYSGTWSVSHDPGSATNPCNPQFPTLLCTLDVGTGSAFYPDVLTIPSVGNGLSPLPNGATATVVDGMNVTTYCLQQVPPSSGIYQFWDHPACSAAVTGLNFPPGSTITFSIPYEATCSGIFELYPVLSGTDNCSIMWTELLGQSNPYIINVSDASGNCPPCTTPPLSCDLFDNGDEMVLNRSIAYEHIWLNNEALVIGSVSEGSGTGANNAYVIRKNGTNFSNEDSQDFGNEEEAYRGIVQNDNVPGQNYALAGVSYDLDQNGRPDNVNIVASQWNASSGSVNWSFLYDISKVPQYAPPTNAGSYWGLDVCQKINDPSSTIVVGMAPYVDQMGMLASRPDAFLMELDGNGMPQDMVRMGSVAKHEDGRAIIAIPDRDEYIFVGRHFDGSRADLFRNAVCVQPVFHQGGNGILDVVEYPMYSFTNSGAYIGRSVIHDDNGTVSNLDDRLYVCGSVSLGPGLWDGFVMAIDYSGYGSSDHMNPLWAIQYRLDPGESTHALDMVLNNDGSLVVAGTSRDPVSGSELRGYAMQILARQSSPAIDWTVRTMDDRQDAVLWSIEPVGAGNTYNLVGWSSDNASGGGQRMLSIDFDPMASLADNCCLEEYTSPIPNIHLNVGKSQNQSVWVDRNLSVNPIMNSGGSPVNEDYEDPCASRTMTNSGTSINVDHIDPSEVIYSDFSLLLYPNPVSESLTIASESNLKSFFVLDVLGREHEMNNAVVMGQKIEMDVTSLTPGLYHVIVTSIDGEIATKSFIKE